SSNAFITICPQDPLADFETLNTNNNNVSNDANSGPTATLDDLDDIMNAVVSGTDDKEGDASQASPVESVMTPVLPVKQVQQPRRSYVDALVQFHAPSVILAGPHSTNLFLSAHCQRKRAGNGSAGTGNQPEVTVCLRDEALASILSAKAVMTQRAFEIKVDDVVFLGYSESLAAAELLVSQTKAILPAQHPSRMRAAQPPPLVRWVRQSAAAPQERRRLVLHQHILHHIRRAMLRAEEHQQAQILDRLNERSQLCRSLTSVFCQLRRGGRVSLRLNGWLPISFCLAHKMHRLAGRCYVLPSLVESCLMSLQPYHCVLPLTDYSSSSNNPLEAGANGGLTYSDLPMDCNPLMSRFLRALSPQKSLLDIRLETDMAYSVALEFARHLVRWGCAIICHPVTDANVYVLNPRLDVLLEESPDLVADYQNQCSSHSQSWPLSPFTPLGDLRDREQAADLPLGLLTWLLRRRLLLQLHTYVTFLPDPVDVADATFGCIDDGLSPNPLPQLPARLRDRLSPPVQLTIQRLPQSSEPADLELLADAVDLLELDSSRSCHIEHLAHHLWAVIGLRLLL
uniref:GATOR complex protein NPRL3 n=1 Tax=Macrostomum lignano TaxID=282301 RepID=A0A1I8F2P5_9PLAT